MPSDVTRRPSVTIGNETKLVSLNEGKGTIKFTGLTAGTHTIDVLYNGDANYIKSSASATVVVN